MTRDYEDTPDLSPHGDPPGGYSGSGPGPLRSDLRSDEERPFRFKEPDSGWRDIALFCDEALPGLRQQRARLRSIASRFARSARELDRVVDSLALVSKYARRAGELPGPPPDSARQWTLDAHGAHQQFNERLDSFLSDATQIVRLLQRRSEAASDVPQNRTDHILGLAEDILAEEGGEDIYYKTLADEVRRRGGPLPKSDRSAYETLIRMMNTDRQKRFIRPFQRGYYALAKDHPDSPNVGVRTGGKQESAD